VDHADRDAVCAAARKAVERDKQHGTDYTSIWLETQRARLAQLKASVADLEEIVGIYDAALSRAGYADLIDHVPVRIDPT
jgi:hypothetical protein